MRILGIDPGLRNTGYACVEIPTIEQSQKTRTQPVLVNLHEPKLIEAGVLKLNASTPMTARLVELYRDLTEIIEQLKPDVMVVEKLYSHYAHPTTSIKMGHARGVILLAGGENGLVIEELAATEVKRSVTGYGHASKEQIQMAVQAQCHLPEPPSPPDVADAIAIALTAARRPPSKPASAVTRKQSGKTPPPVIPLP